MKLAQLAAASFLLLLTACGSAGEPPVATEGQSGDSVTQTVEHLKGTSEIPEDIERIVVLSAAYADHLLTIGEKPVGINVEARYGGDYLPYLADGLSGVQTVGSASAPNLEAILALDPEVIVVESRTAEEMYGQLEKIAPTIVLGNEWLDYGDDTTFWTQDLLAIADMYDKTEAAEEAISALDEKVAAANEKIVALEGRKLAYLRVREKLLQVYAQKGHPTNTLLYHDLGFEPGNVTPDEQRIDLSMEIVPEMDADYIAMEVDPNGREYLESMNESELWNEVSAVQNDQVYETDSFWLFKGWGAIGRGEIVDDVLQMVE
ncbi:iron-siderophore ABC transporter substrate-binding protein [Aureibacillus halotolerans]|uniref:Bacillibactin-binding protein n=1 Tax=Aureibacillus halotolerans TaxID=1508390 RepID=A0A4R6U2V0_9BACI|nr:iron-siderophore ABC transporter substrate-binding protein [Aureibacillus halotolerans]TDQ40758.1 bacillibactin-binding protein [Aureibacillus halotolerans]